MGGCTKNGLWGDFNEVLDNSEKCEGLCKSRMAMKEFRKVVDEMALVDVKSDRGWFT